MKTGFAYSYSDRQPIYRKLKRQVVAEFSEELKQATGWKKVWVRWKRGLALEIRYNGLLFADCGSQSIELTSVLQQPK